MCNCQSLASLEADIETECIRDQHLCNREEAEMDRGRSGIAMQA